MTYAVIMAGGVGSRFWPASTKKFPKQFLSLFSDQSLLQNTVQRIKNRIGTDRIYIITNRDYVDLVQQQVPQIPESQIIGEPVAKNTAPCVAAAAKLIYQRDKEATMAVLPADHYISQPDKFDKVLASAIATARSQDCLVTIGIEPDRPETGYGYIQFDSSTQQKVEANKVFAVKKFTEKPDLQTAERFLKSGDFLWNSGMFIWKAEVILEEFRKQLPDMYRLADAIKPEEGSSSIDAFYHACNSISIDYGIMEGANHVFVVPGSFGWNDVGSWKAVYELSDKNEQGNVQLSRFAHFEDSEASLIFSKSKKMITLAGLNNVGIIETDKAILVVNLDEAQKVKNIVNRLKEDDELNEFI